MGLENSESKRIVSRRDLIRIGAGGAGALAVNMLGVKGVEAENCHVQIQRVIRNYINRGGNPFAYSPNIDQSGGVISGAVTKFEVNNQVVSSATSNGAGNVLLDVQVSCEGLVRGTLNVQAPDGRFGNTSLTIPNGMRQSGTVWIPESIAVTPTVSPLRPTPILAATGGSENNPEYNIVSLSNLDRILGLVSAGMIAAAILLKGRERILIGWFNRPNRSSRSTPVVPQQTRSIRENQQHTVQNRSVIEETPPTTGRGSASEGGRSEQVTFQEQSTSRNQESFQRPPIESPTSSANPPEESTPPAPFSASTDEAERNRRALRSFRERIGETEPRRRIKLHISGTFSGDIDTREEAVNE